MATAVVVAVCLSVGTDARAAVPDPPPLETCTQPDPQFAAASLSDTDVLAALTADWPSDVPALSAAGVRASFATTADSVAGPAADLWVRGTESTLFAGQPVGPNTTIDSKGMHDAAVQVLNPVLSRSDTTEAVSLSSLATVASNGALCAVSGWQAAILGTTIFWVLKAGLMVALLSNPVTAGFAATLSSAVAGLVAGFVTAWVRRGTVDRAVLKSAVLGAMTALIADVPPTLFVSRVLLAVMQLVSRRLGNTWVWASAVWAGISPELEMMARSLPD